MMIEVEVIAQPSRATEHEELGGDFWRLATYMRAFAESATAFNPHGERQLTLNLDFGLRGEGVEFESIAQDIGKVVRLWIVKLMLGIDEKLASSVIVDPKLAPKPPHASTFTSPHGMTLRVGDTVYFNVVPRQTFDQPIQKRMQLELMFSQRAQVLPDILIVPLGDGPLKTVGIEHKSPQPVVEPDMLYFRV